MVAQVEFQSLIGSANCVNGGAAPLPNIKGEPWFKCSHCSQNLWL